MVGLMFCSTLSAEVASTLCFDVEERISETGKRLLSFLGCSGEAHHGRFTHDPVTLSAIFKSYNITTVHAKHLNYIKGTTLWHDPEFNKNKTFEGRGATWGDTKANVGEKWERPTS